MSHPVRTYHLVPKDHWEASDPAGDYLPEPFAEEGFIHTTHQPEELVAVANRSYRDDPRPYLVLHIDVAKVRAPIRIEDPGGRYPHIYGPLNRDAIVAVTAAARDDTGEFQSPMLRDGS
jgi:uncharacterized protein (DUF952 family)